MAEIYDCAIVGGGLAGLSLSILLAKKGKKVAVFEKDNYPAHKVCGEYVSMESWPFLNSLGLDLAKYNLPQITKLQISTPSGFLLHSNLDLGGFGISRYLLDELLFSHAKECGVHVFVNTKVDDVLKCEQYFEVLNEGGRIHSKMVFGSWGKRSNLDLKWNRDFAIRQKNGLTNFVGVKYHIKTDFPSDSIALHNFKDGYCGISKIEGDCYCLCYLTSSENIRKYDGIGNMEQQLLSRNPFLKTIFSESDFLFDKPLAISQISFLHKNIEQNGILMLGDAAGTIAPLCGNGMSMAFRSAKLLAELIEKDGFNNLTKNYQKKWNNEFSTRLFVGNTVQQLFGKNWTTELVVRTLGKIPFLLNKLVKATHGELF